MYKELKNISQKEIQEYTDKGCIIKKFGNRIRIWKNDKEYKIWQTLYHKTNSYLSSGKNSYICTQCGNEVSKKYEQKGSSGVELVLWLMVPFFLLLFILPGIIMGGIATVFSVRRMCCRDVVCRECGNKNTLVPINSPVGIKFRIIS